MGPASLPCLRYEERDVAIGNDSELETSVRRRADAKSFGHMPMTEIDGDIPMTRMLAISYLLDCRNHDGSGDYTGGSCDGTLIYA